jgi:hypothetical protein
MNWHDHPWNWWSHWHPLSFITALPTIFAINLAMVSAAPRSWLQWVQGIVAYSQQKVLMVMQMRELFCHLANVMQEKFHTWHKLALFICSDNLLSLANIPVRRIMIITYKTGSAISFNSIYMQLGCFTLVSLLSHWTFAWEICSPTTCFIAAHST